MTIRFDLLLMAVKEPLRWAWLGLLAYLLAENVLMELIEAFLGARLTPEQRVLLVPGLTAFLRGLDKYMHEYGKETGNDLLTKGLTFGQ